MYKHKNDNTVENKSRLAEKAETGKGLSNENNKTFSSGNSVLDNANGRIVDPSITQSHASTLRRAKDSHPSQAGHFLLQLQRQYGNSYVQRVIDLYRKADRDTSVAPETEQSIQQARGGGQALDSKVRTQMESSFDADFSGVRVHTNSQANNLNRELSSRAFTTGKDIFFGQGEYNTGSSSERELLAHELTHVVQQTGGVQGKMRVGQPGDKYEQEADQVARAIMGDEQKNVQGDSGRGLAHRQVESEKEEEETVQTRTEDFSPQRQIEEDEAEEIQTKADKTTPSQDQKGDSFPLPRELRISMEEALNDDFSEVRVNTDAVAEKLGGSAFTSGNDIHFASGKYDPDSQRGRDLLGHELVHVSQQRQNRVPALKGTGSPEIVYEPKLEAEADREGAKAARASHPTSKESSKNITPRAPAGRANMVMQGVWPAWLLALGIGSWEAAAQAAAVVGIGAAISSQAVGAVADGESGAQGLILPQNFVTGADKQSLREIAQFRIINEYVTRHIQRHPEALRQLQEAYGGGRAAPARRGRTRTRRGSGSTESTATPEISAIDQQIMSGVKEYVGGQLLRELESNLHTRNAEFLWTEDNAHDVPDAVGASGYVRLRNLQGAAIRQTLELTGEAARARDILGVAGEGQERTVRKFIGGRLEGEIIESWLMDLTISIVGGGATLLIAPSIGGPRIDVGTRWYWDWPGFNESTFLDLWVVVMYTGEIFVGHEYRNVPGS